MYKRQVIDLTQEIREDMPMFPGDEPPVLEHVASCGRDGYRETKLTFYSHTGTHADAPSHIADGRTRLEQFSLSPVSYTHLDVYKRQLLPPVKKV